MPRKTGKTTWEGRKGGREEGRKRGREEGRVEHKHKLVLCLLRGAPSLSPSLPPSLLFFFPPHLINQLLDDLEVGNVN